MGPVEYLGIDLEQISKHTGLPPLSVFPWRTGDLALMYFFCLTFYFPKSEVSPLNFSSSQPAEPWWPPALRDTMKQVAHEMGTVSDLLEV